MIVRTDKFKAYIILIPPHWSLNRNSSSEKKINNEKRIAQVILINNLVFKPLHFQCTETSKLKQSLKVL